MQFIIFSIIATICWLVSEFHGKRAFRIIMGLVSLGCAWFVAFVALFSYGFTNSHGNQAERVAMQRLESTLKTGNVEPALLAVRTYNEHSGEDKLSRWRRTLNTLSEAERQRATTQQTTETPE